MRVASRGWVHFEREQQRPYDAPCAIDPPTIPPRADPLDFLSLKNKILSLTGRALVLLVVSTEPTMRVRDNPYVGRARKRSTLRAWVGDDYARIVNERRMIEGKPADFVPAKRRWGNRVENTPLIEHDGKTYLETLVDSCIDTTYLVDGKPVDEAVLKPFFPDKRAPSSRQGLDDEVVVRTFNLDNIQAFMPLLED